MADFSKLVITNEGKRLLNQKLSSNEELMFTEMAMSENIYDIAALESLTDLEGIRQRTGIRKISRIDNTIQIDAVFLNSDLEEGYFTNTLGVYGCIGGGAPVLFALAVERTSAAYMPQKSQTQCGIEIKLKITLENADNITIQMDQSAMATIGDVLAIENSIKCHIEDFNNPHQTDKAQVGLGKVDNTSDISKPVSTAQQDAIDAAYRQATAYADRIVNALVNGAPGTLDTLGEIAEAMKENADVVQALEQAIGSKASEADFAGHADNNTIHVTASEREEWNEKADADHSHDYLPLSGGTMDGPILQKNNIGLQWFHNEGPLIGALKNTNETYQVCLAPDGWKTVDALKSALYLGYIDGNLQIRPRTDGTPWYLTGFRSKFNSGDIDNPTEWANVPVLESDEEHDSMWRKVSLFFKNVRYLWKLMGNTSLSGIGDGTVTGAISSLNTGLNWKYVGYVTGTDRLSLPFHKEVWVSVDFQSDASFRRAMIIPNIDAFETDLYGQIGGVTDCVHIYYHQSVVGMYPKNDNGGTENLKLSAWYR